MEMFTVKRARAVSLALITIAAVVVNAGLAFAVGNFEVEWDRVLAVLGMIGFSQLNKLPMGAMWLLEGRIRPMAI